MGNSLHMYQNRKFSRAAKTRRYLAIAASILLHLGLFAAISSDNEEIKELIPDFVKELFEKDDKPTNETPRA